MSDNSRVPKKQPFRKYIYNKEQKRILGRTKKGCCILIVFYLIFYICLTSLCLLYHCLYFMTIPTDHPKYELGDSIIGVNPGVGVRPRQTEANINSALIWVKESKGDCKKLHYVEDLKKLLSPTKKTENRKQRFELETLGACSKECFGYDKKQPCVILALNKVYNWNPEYYTKDDLPEDMPTDLKEHINTSGEKMVYISCEGEFPADTENIGEIAYYPSSRGIPEAYFPFLNQKGYTRPLVAVQFLSPKPGVLIHAYCKAWAKNIDYQRGESKGSVRIQLMVD